MATSWKSQQGKGKYALQFETDDEGKYKLVEKAAQMAMDGKTVNDIAEIRHGKWESKWSRLANDLYFNCSFCGESDPWQGKRRGRAKYCPRCGAKMDGKEGSGHGQHK